MKLSTIEYLYRNNNDIATAMHFTKNDLLYLDKIEDDILLVNYDKPTKEELRVDDIINRLIDLYKLAKVTRTISGIFNTPKAYMDNLDYVFDKIEQDFDVELKRD